MSSYASSVRMRSLQQEDIEGGGSLRGSANDLVQSSQLQYVSNKHNVSPLYSNKYIMVRISGIFVKGWCEKSPSCCSCCSETETDRKDQQCFSRDLTPNVASGEKIPHIGGPRYTKAPGSGGLFVCPDNHDDGVVYPADYRGSVSWHLWIHVVPGQMGYIKG